VAGWTFLAWGLFHGTLLCGYRMLKQVPGQAHTGGLLRAWRSAVSVLTMFHLTCIGWLLFRAETIGQAAGMLQKMLFDLRATELSTYTIGMIAFYAGPLLLFEYWLERSGDLLRLVKVHWLFRTAVYSYGAVMILLFHPTVYNDFIYFQF